MRDSHRQIYIERQRKIYLKGETCGEAETDKNIERQIHKNRRRQIERKGERERKGYIGNESEKKVGRQIEKVYCGKIYQNSWQPVENH